VRAVGRLDALELLEVGSVRDAIEEALLPAG
jgi:hypothetical protein